MDKIAVLIPCYNEEKTIAKVIRDSRQALPEAEFMYMTTIPRTKQGKLPERKEQSYGRSICRGKATSSGVCSVK